MEAPIQHIKEGSMQLINKSDLLAPGVCALCESSPSDGDKIVDTLKNLVTGFPYQFAGRKYVCEGCIKALGAVVGLSSDEAQQEAQRKLAIAEAQLTAVGGFLDGFAQEIRDGKFKDVVETAGVPADEVKSGLEAAVEAGTDPGAAVIAGATAPAEADGQTVTAAETETAHADAAPPTFDPSLTDASPKTDEGKKKAPKPKTDDEIAAENPPVAAELAAEKEVEAAEAAKNIEDAKEGS